MKRIGDMLCASQASTAICLSMDPYHQIIPSTSSSLAHLGGSPAIDRHNPIIRDATRTVRSLPIPCSSSQPPPLNPIPYHQLIRQHTKRNSLSTSSSASSSSSTSSSKQQSAKSRDDLNQRKKKKKQKNKSSSNGSSSSSSQYARAANILMRGFSTKKESATRKSSAKLGDFSTTTPSGSTRYLLSDSSVVDGSSDQNKLVGKDGRDGGHDQLDASKKPSSSTSSSPFKPASNQVVVLRVSLHCKGCEGKVRKHLSRMEGVTSFNIDFAAKKVSISIEGDMTPLGVLSSVAKVKSAQFWTPPSSSISATAPSATDTGGAIATTTTPTQA